MYYFNCNFVIKATGTVLSQCLWLQSIMENWDKHEMQTLDVGGSRQACDFQQGGHRAGAGSSF